MNLIDKLVGKSKEAFIMGLEIYNKPTIRYRVEGFSFFICNAWELLLKAYMIKKLGENSIYYKDNADRTLNLENCIKKVLTNKNDPARINLETIIGLRNISTHFITEEYEQIYVPLFQACVTNYINKLLTYFNQDITEELGNNFLTLSVKLDSFGDNDILARYPKHIAEKLLRTQTAVNAVVSDNPSPDVAITIKHDWCLTKKKDTSTMTFTYTKDAEMAAIVIKEPKDMQVLCPFNAKSCVEIIERTIRKEKINFINPIAQTIDKKNIFNKYHFDLFIKFYSIKQNHRLCYRYSVNRQSFNSYSQKVIDMILEEIKKDPEHIIQNLKKRLKK